MDRDEWLNRVNGVKMKDGNIVSISGHTKKYVIHPPSEEHGYPVIIRGGPITGNKNLIQLKAGEEQLNITMIGDDGAMVGEYTLEQQSF